MRRMFFIFAFIPYWMLQTNAPLNPLCKCNGEIANQYCPVLFFACVDDSKALPSKITLPLIRRN